MHQADTISGESAIVVLKSIQPLALTGAGLPSTFEDQTRDRTRRNGAAKADLAWGVIATSSSQIFSSQHNRFYREIRLMYRSDDLAEIR